MYDKIPGITANEIATINRGNVMLLQAGMPMMTVEQAQTFLEKQRARKAKNLPGVLLGLTMLGVILYDVYRGKTYARL